MANKIKKIIMIVVIIILTFVTFLIITNPNKVDNLLYKITGNYYFSDINHKINKNELISIAQNKDYSNSIYYPYYELLNDNQKVVYQEIIRNANKYVTKFEIEVILTRDELKETFYSVLYDHPEIFWLNLSYSISVNENNEIQSIELSYNDIINDIENAKQKFNDEIDKIVSEAKKQKTDYEKELYVHDTLIQLIEYDLNEEKSQNVYDAITNKKAVCAEYTKLFQIIMMKLEIPTYYISGYANENHAWNLIELEDGFYNVDITWDDQKDKIIYKYFNVSDEMISKDHKRGEMSAKLIRNNGEKYLNKLSTLYK